MTYDASETMDGMASRRAAFPARRLPSPASSPCFFGGDFDVAPFTPLLVFVLVLMLVLDGGLGDAG